MTGGELAGVSVSPSFLLPSLSNPYILLFQTEQTLFGLWGHSDARTGVQPQRLGPEPLPLGKVTDLPLPLDHSSQCGDLKQEGVMWGQCQERRVALGLAQQMVGREPGLLWASVSSSSVSGA